MSNLAWSDYFVTGIAVVDMQHRHLVDLVNRVAPVLAAARDEVPEGVELLFQEFFDYASVHFETEEALMRARSMDARHVEHHLAEHHRFVDSVQAMADEFLRGGQVTGARILDFVTHWLIFHILGEDQAMARQIHAICEGRPSEEAYMLELAGSLNPARKALTESLIQLHAQWPDSSGAAAGPWPSLRELLAEHARRLPQASALRVNPGGWRILLVEDDAVDREVAFDLLGHAGLRADIAENGMQALELVASERYDLVLMDVRMPKLDGLEATRRIRLMGAAGCMPILAMTANTFPEDRAVCLTAGMNDFIGKPINPETFYASLLRWLAADGSAT